MYSEILKFFRKSISSKIRQDIVVTMISQSVVMFLALLLNKLLSNMLGVEGYGQYSIIKKSSSVISFVILGGMGIALPRFFPMAIAKQNFTEAKSYVISSLNVVLITGVLIVGAAIVFKNSLSGLIIGTGSSTLYYATILFAVSITFSSWLFAYYRGSNAFLNFAISQVVIQILLTLSAIIWGSNLQNLLWAWSGLSFLYVIISFSFDLRSKPIFNKYKLKWKLDLLPQTKTLFRYGLPRMAGDFIMFSLAAFPLIYINKKLGIVASSYFAVGITLTAIISPFFSFLGMVLLPHVSTSIANNQFNSAKKLINKLMLLYIAASAAVTLLLSFGMNFFITVFFSLDFLDAAFVSKIIALSILFESIFLLLRNPIDAVSHFPFNAFNLLISLIVMIFLFAISETLSDFALSFLVVTIVRAIITFFTWLYFSKKLCTI